jgi:hypothetical protein
MNDNKPSDTVRQFSKIEAYGMLGGTALMGAVLVAIPFVGLFVAASLALPLTIDIRKYGKDNILNRAGKELQECWRIVKADVKERATSFKAALLAPIPVVPQSRTEKLWDDLRIATIGVIGAGIAAAGILGAAFTLAAALKTNEAPTAPAVKQDLQSQQCGKTTTLTKGNGNKPTKCQA